MLDSFSTGDSDPSVITGTTIAGVFGEDGRLSGSAGCNNYFGSYTVTGTSLSISSPGSIKMNSPGRGIMPEESSCLVFLGKAAAISISRNWLSLVDANGTTLRLFTGKSGREIRNQVFFIMESGEYSLVIACARLNYFRAALP
jgi:hypothetical protein